MLIKEVFLYRMRHIKEAIVVIMVCLVISLPMPVYADSLQEVLRAQSGIEVIQEENHSQLVSFVEISQERTEEKLAKIQAEVQRAAKEAERARIREERIERAQPIEDATYTVPTAGGGWCAAWVSQVYQSAGFGYPGGNACDMYYKYCTYNDISQARSGMIIAVATHPHSSAGSRYGHCGILLERNGEIWVRHNTGVIEETRLQDWIDYYGITCTPKWGWGFGN